MTANSRPSSKTFKMVAKTIFGLEEILAKELTAIGAKNIKCLDRAVEFTGNQELLYAANIWCRTATRILKPVADFRANDEEELYRRVLKIEWDKLFSLEQTFVIDVVISKSVFDHTLYVAQKTKDAIADYFRNKTGQRPSVDTKNPNIRIGLYISHNNCSIAIDSSGEPLFKRGYRTRTGKAPLHEVLAAGLVYQSGWDQNSPFVDGMCGSGTIVIEAGQIARNIAPGLSRKRFGFMNWPDYDVSLYKSICRRALKEINPPLGYEIIGSDRNSTLIAEAAENAKQAGLDGDITFKQSSLTDMTPPEPPGVLIINPPYGERIPVDDINRFYKSIGDAFKKNFTGYDAFVFTGNFAAAKNIGLRTSRRIEMYNGPIECRLLKFEMYQGTRKVKKDSESGTE